jgi:hypothetical protein
VLTSRAETLKKQTGRKPAITDKMRERLVARATLNAAYRWMTYKEIAWVKSVQASPKALIAAFKTELYGRRVATAKPLLTKA